MIQKFVETISWVEIGSGENPVKGVTYYGKTALNPDLLEIYANKDEQYILKMVKSNSNNFQIVLNEKFHYPDYGQNFIHTMNKMILRRDECDYSEVVMNKQYKAISEQIYEDVYYAFDFLSTTRKVNIELHPDMEFIYPGELWLAINSFVLSTTKTVIDNYTLLQEMKNFMKS